MARLASEWLRLFVPPGSEGLGTPDALRLTSADGQVRAMVLELAGPADWSRLSAVWQGVQTELEWPAPAIAVNGRNGHQLWFSLAAAVPQSEAAAVVEGLRRHWLADLPLRRVRCWPAPEPEGQAVPQRRMQPVPSRQEAAQEQWSAFVLPGLAPVFADDPWLDTPPNPDAQADLLSRLTCIPRPAWDRAWDALRYTGSEHPGSARPTAQACADSPNPAWPPQAHTAARTVANAPGPREFLTSVMNDAQAPLALRIEAAKALLPGS